MAETPSKIKKEDLVVTRIIDAPLELVWQAWTEPEHVRRWWGPKDYTSPVCKIDLREGGSFLFCMRSPVDQGGQDSYSTGVYSKIVPMERLEFNQYLSDQDGNKIDPAQAGMPPDFPREMRMVIVFKPIGSLTQLTITSYDWTVSQMYVYAFAGWQQSIDKLAAFLANH